jgi:phage-related minor tail protein
MDWKRERDLLVAQTLAFVQSVTGSKSGLEPDAEAAPIGAVDIEAIAAAIKTVEPPRRAQISGVQASGVQVSGVQVSGVQVSGVQVSGVSQKMVPSEFQTEIQNRIASFRAHQERFNRERAEYFGTTLSKIRAAIEDASASARPRK